MVPTSRAAAPLAPAAPRRGRCTAPRRRLPPPAALRARWLLDARYGCKQDATALLVEWVQTVGAEAGVPAAAARISTGALGAPESRLEVRGLLHACLHACLLACMHACMHLRN